MVFEIKKQRFGPLIIWSLKTAQESAILVEASMRKKGFSMRFLGLITLLFLGLTSCAIHNEVQKTTQAIGDVSNKIVEERSIPAGGTTVQVSPASKAEDGQLRIKF